jgi:calcineurin-like phosphoesterase family protein
MKNQVFSWSDQHFGHSNIIKYCNRPFSDVEEMNETLIRNHNSVVNNDDHVIFNGDFMFYKKDTGIFSRLNGIKTLVRGNHDHEATENLGWDFIYDIFEFNHMSKRFVMCHYPMIHWNKKNNGSIHLYGHVHDEGNAKVEKIPNRYNICVEMTNYYPVNLKTFIGD